MEELDHVLGRVGLHHRVVELVAADHAAQRNHAVGHALGEVQHVGHHAEIVRREVGAHAPEAGDDLVEDQQDAVLVADLAQALQIALRRQVPAGRTGHRLHDDRGHVARVVQRQDAGFELDQRVFGPHRLRVVDVGMVHRVVDEAHVVHARQKGRAEHLAVARNAAHRHAAEAHAVVALLAADEHVAVALAARAVVGQRHLHRGVGGLGARVAEQHLVQVARGQRGDHFGRLEGLVVADLEGGGVVQRVQLLLDRLVDRLAVVARAHAPQRGDAVDHLLAVVRGERHAVGRHENPRVLLEMAVGREGQPLVVHVEVLEGHVSLLRLCGEGKSRFWHPCHNPAPDDDHYACLHPEPLLSRPDGHRARRVGLPARARRQHRRGRPIQRPWHRPVLHARALRLR
ncbi:hypothetical protein D3C72_1154950 [compost metagenome]